MSASTEIKKICDLVRELLENFPHLRDDDDKLVANIWIRELGGAEKAKEVSAYYFLAQYSGYKAFTSAESITRARRKLQNTHLHLRGEKYLERMTEQENVKEFIKKSIV